MPNANEKKSIVLGIPPIDLATDIAEARSCQVRITRVICDYCRGIPELKEQREHLIETYLSEAYLATTNEPRLNASQKQTGDVPATSNSTSEVDQGSTGLDTENPWKKVREDMRKIEGIYMSILIKIQEEVELINQMRDYLGRNAEKQDTGEGSGEGEEEG